MIIEFEGFSCPTINTAAHSSSLENAELISYQGTEHYGTNFTGYLNGQGAPSTIWFTNSTIFCVSPMTSGYATCPTHPILPSIMIIDSSASTLNSSTGLRLDLQLSTNASYAGSLRVEMDIFNTRPSVNNVTAADSWPISPTALRDICADFATGYAVFQGNYDSSNFTSGAPLALLEPELRCPAELPPAYLSFIPESDNASISGGNTPPLRATTYTMSVSDSLEGYWTGTTTTSIFNPFPPGIYTVVAVDQWGQTAAARFAVQRMTLQNFSLCPSNCNYPSPYLSGEIYFGGPSLVKSLELFVNGTDEGKLGHGIGVTNVIYQYKGSFQSPQVIAGDAYVIKFVAVFEDNSTATASTTVVAG